MADNLNFDFEAEIESSYLIAHAQQQVEPPDLPAEAIGQQPANYRKNFRKTVCTYWLRGLCMKGDACGFLHQFVTDRMPVCRNLLKYGECREQDCPYKHSMDEIKECNMYKLGFCIYGPVCRYKHIKNPGPPPGPEEVEAAKPREHRNINVVVNQVNPGVARDDERPAKRPRQFGGRDRDRERDRRGGGDRPLALPAPPPMPGADGAAGGGGGGWFDDRGRGPPADGARGRGGGGGGGWRGGRDDADAGGPQGLGRDQTGGAPPAAGPPPPMPPVTAPGPAALPPMAGLLAPVMPNIMPPLQPPGPGGPMGGGPPMMGPPPGGPMGGGVGMPMGGGPMPGGPMGGGFPGLFPPQNMMGQGFFPRPF